MARSLNRATLIGNLTRDPELRYTPQGTAVVTFSVATNRQWKTASGEMKDEAEFHRIVAWDKLAEICSNLLKKGSKVMVEGRIQTRKWQTKEGEDRTTVEIIISDMMLLDRSGDTSSSEDDNIPADFDSRAGSVEVSKKEAKGSKKTKTKKVEDSTKEVTYEDDDIPF
ncbi:hypothetical protein A2801_01945 [Candidatus Woesebacteria bacterium RIFCSPHIGHO2_01_FULL_41_10]|uniref:Single-stranded DNA-binding protein n=1 Tax=Candidatus Woesebacteria bacterium RIFCSPHIGHO2_01_FULL_41_10 TaxID=1802500 RepID=A0A1F7YR09_9BACT|nr:MAG: hypothetical protein A2801_01945 [Candidatus Woesebacteria bacterium RIFCSPHIGHO2_01_FULL_41_10]